MSQHPEILVFKFHKKNILAQDLEPYLDLLKALSSDKGKAWRFMHRVVFSVDGYDLDPRELSVIPEVITFFKTLHKAWPYFLYFSIPMQENFDWWMTILYFKVVGRDDQTQIFVEVTPETYSLAMGDFFSHANAIAHQHNFNDEEYLARQTEIVDKITAWCQSRPAFNF